MLQKVYRSNVRSIQKSIPSLVRIQNRPKYSAWTEGGLESQRVPGAFFKPETTSLNLGHHPKDSRGSVKVPLYMSSTFAFETAEEGKRAFSEVFGLPGASPRSRDTPMIYSRVENPNITILEERIKVWDDMEHSLLFASGMGALSTTAFALLKPGDHLISSRPIYGGSDHLFSSILPAFGIKTHFVYAGDDCAEQAQRVADEVGPEKIKLFFIETPSNPSLVHTDIESCKKVIEYCNEERASHGLDTKAHLACDNTLLGPKFQSPSQFGADIILYSATKFLGGHSDVVAGVISCTDEVFPSIYLYRTIQGSISDPFVGFLLLRSLETVSIRQQRQTENAQALAQVLEMHPAVKSINFPGLRPAGSKQQAIYKKQCTAPGSLITFDIVGGEKEAFQVLNAVEVFHLAVSLGGTESLVEHPWTMTHAEVDHGPLATGGITESTIRVSVGIEHETDLKRDMVQALNTITTSKIKTNFH